MPGGNIYRWYIRMSVRAPQLPACTCCLEEPCLWRVDELQMHDQCPVQCQPQPWSGLMSLAALHPATRMQARKVAGCQRNYMGMRRNVCSEMRTQLFTLQDTSASLVWMVEPVVPGAPTITAAAVTGGLQAGVLAVTLQPSAYMGFLPTSNFTVECTSPSGPTIKVVGPGTTVGGQVRGVCKLWQLLDRRPAGCGAANSHRPAPSRPSISLPLFALPLTSAEEADLPTPGV